MKKRLFSIIFPVKVFTTKTTFLLKQKHTFLDKTKGSFTCKTLGRLRAFLMKKKEQQTATLRLFDFASQGLYFKIAFKIFETTFVESTIGAQYSKASLLRFFYETVSWSSQERSNFQDKSQRGYILTSSKTNFVRGKPRGCADVL